MERYYGFDLGDAESAVSYLQHTDVTVPKVLTVRGEKSFITAYAKLYDGKILIGESACYQAGVSDRKIRFKSRFLTDRDAVQDVRRFAAGVLAELYGSGSLVQGEECCFYVGCPAGWDRAARERYREIFEQAGYPPTRIISESRAALVSACQSRHFRVSYDITQRPVLVVDIGSSTTDFAYIMGGREVELQTAGEVFLGGGMMDEILLDLAVEASPEAKEIREVFEKSPQWKSYSDFAARRLKEQYFYDEEYWQTRECVKTVPIVFDRQRKLVLKMNAENAERILECRSRFIPGGRSFHEAFSESLQEVRGKIQGQMPELLFLTGGVSKLQRVRDWCQEAFPEAVVITGAEPEFSVSRGLAWSGRIDEELRRFRSEIQDLVASSVVERLVAGRIQELYHLTVDTLVEPILRSAALPVFERWRSGEIRRLSDIDGEMQREIEAYLHSPEAGELLVKPIAAWLRPVAYALEEHTMPICAAHNVPFKALSLNSYLTLSDIDIRVDAKGVFAMEELSWMINAIISILVGLLCGGSGIALISGGISGIVAGAMLSLAVLLLGKDRMQEAVMNAEIPVFMRRTLPAHYFENRLEKISSEVKRTFFENLETEKNEEISTRMVSEISAQIEKCLTQMAEVVEIPLG